MIYIIQSQELNAYKLGFTSSPLETRLKEIQNGSSGGDKSCILIHNEEGDLKLEKQIFKELDTCKIEHLNHKEWVNCSLAMILDTINCLKVKSIFKKNQDGVVT